MQTSVVVPTRNRPAGLHQLLLSLAHQRLPPSEVIVVDDFSDNHIVRNYNIWKRQDLPFDFRWFRLNRNLGPAAARNFGVVNAEKEIICFTDDDCEPDSHWIYEMASAFGVDPNAAGFGGPIRSAGSSRFNQFFDYHHLLDPKFDNKTGQPVYLVTANAAYRREWILKVGGFDEDITRPGGEDPGLAYKIVRAGGRLSYAPKALVLHKYPRRFSSIVRMFRNYGYGARIVASAYPPERNSSSGPPRVLGYSLPLEGLVVHRDRGLNEDSVSEKELSPPYVRELPKELFWLERDYRKAGLGRVSRIFLHLAWVTFRLSYFEGWREAGSLTRKMPHRFVADYS